MRQQRYIKEKLMDLHIQREIVPTLNDHIGLVIDGDSDKAADIDELSGYIHEYLIEYYKTFIKKKKNETKQEFLKRKKNVKIDYTFKDVTRFLMKYNINSSEMYLDNFVSFGMMLCPFTSLINHSCNPNCHIRINPKTKNMELRVLTDIDVGDELFVTYLGNETTKPTRARKEVLKSKYYFECNCNLCKPTTKKRKMMERYPHIYKHIIYIVSILSEYINICTDLCLSHVVRHVFWVEMEVKIIKVQEVLIE